MHLFDLTPVLVRNLEDDGWMPMHTRRPRRTRRASGQPFVGDLKPRTHVRNGDGCVVTGPMVVKPASNDRHAPPATALPSPSDLQDAFEAELDRLSRQLANLRRALGSGRIRLVFSGGGTLQIPEWFLDRMRQLGVQIDVVYPDGSVDTLQPGHDVSPQFTPRWD